MLVILVASERGAEPGEGSPASRRSRTGGPSGVSPGILGASSVQPDVLHTGGRGSITQWVHVEYIEGSEIICPTFTQWVRGGYFSKIPTKVPTG